MKAIAKQEWECKEAEDFAFCTDSKHYHSHIFAILALKACTPLLADACHSLSNK